MDKEIKKALKQEKKKNIKRGKKDLTMTEKKVEVAKISFTFPLTRDEAKAVINKPNGVVAKGLKKYMTAVLEAACQKFIDTPEDKDVTNCKVNIK